METAILFSPASLAAAFVVVVCGGAMVTVWHYTLRIIRVPKLHSLDEQIARKSVRRDELDGQIIERQAELATADKEKAELAVLRQEKEQHALELADLLDKIANLAGDRAQIDEVQFQLAATMDKFAQASQDLKDLENTRAEAEQAVQGLATRRQEMQGAIETLGKLLDDARQQLETLKADISKAKVDLEEANRANTREQGALDELKRQRASETAALEETRQAAERLRGEQAACQGAVERLTEEQSKISEAIAKLAADRVNFTEEVADLKSRAEREQREIARIGEEQERARGQLKDLEQRTAAAQAALSEIDQATERLRGERSAIEGAIDRLTAEHKGLVDGISQATEEKRGITAEVAALRVQAEGVQRDIKRLNEEIVSAAAERKREEVTIHELRYQKDVLEGQIARLTQTLGRIEGKAGPKTDEEAELALADLRVPPDELVRARRRIGSLSEVDALKRVREHLQSQGYVFSERVIDAFHTSLKISSISPLTVLAGISGTGKSELPRQYAKAIGLPFFQLAVQPRWDSPQDLFGFYNYLEHRYKPTELVRAMVHLDNHFWPKEAEPYKDHMALVLLDEMNLARVEYYFSEFLSRLEVRRDKEDEPAAEIELELGHLPEGQTNKLYPVPRLLFVGTMNEDESTQTLSDKVVDRANVLRFSRPKDLVSTLNTNGANQGSVADAEAMLPYGVWKGWLKKDAPGGNARLEDWLRKLNGHMEVLGRPFGHRMGQAIRAYVVNHPRSAGGASAEAMADQLEMRLFPKLRGIEPNDGDHPRALDGIQQFIEQELHDEKLAEAFQTARGKDLFLWRGVHRDL